MGNVPLVKCGQSGWLTFAEAADLLAVDVRTIKRWMKRKEIRNALLAVRHSGRWRIPRPVDLFVWDVEARQRLKPLGIYPKKAVDRKIENLAQEFDRYRLESQRLWMAAYAKALAKGRIMVKARCALLDLWHAACRILSPLRRTEMDVEKLKAKFPRHLWRYWPGKEQFREVHPGQIAKELEAMRRKMDFVQAVRDARRRELWPTAKNLCPRLHQDFVKHINDTKEELPPTPAGWIDSREPQEGITVYEFRQRYPLRKKPWVTIIRIEYDYQGSLPGSEEMRNGRKTPQRGSRDSEGHLRGIPESR